jgi:hypothetical protein
MRSRQDHDEASSWYGFDSPGSSAIGPEALAFMKTNVCYDDRLREEQAVNILHIFRLTYLTSNSVAPTALPKTPPSIVY